MLPCLILYVLFHFALAQASSDAWLGTDMSSTSSSSKSQAISFVVYPIEPRHTEQIAAGEETLRQLCGSDSFRREQQAEGEEISWIVTVTDPDIVARLSADPSIRFDEIVDEQSRQFTKRDEPTEYEINPDDYNNDTETKEIYKFLKTKTKQPDKIVVIHVPGTSHTLCWGRVFLDAEGKKEVEGFQGVNAVYEAVDVDDDRMIPTSKDRTAAGQSEKPPAGPGMVQGHMNKRKESVKWTKQTNAGWDLVMVSQPKEMDGEELKDFVYDEKAGEGTWIYVIDAGVTYDVKNDNGDPEFLKKEPLQTKLSKDLKEPEDKDSSDISHGTHVASKALGQKYGVAKKATLVSVKTRKQGQRRFIDFTQALETVLDNLIAKPERQSKSVVIASLGFPDSRPRQTVLAVLYDVLFDLGVPFISSAGNKGETILKIDKLPKVMEGQRHPIINVGGCDFERQKAVYSQAGPQLTLYGPGGSGRKEMSMQSREEGKEDMAQGTSFAAPIVAGVLATYLNNDPLPWDSKLKGKARVRAIKSLLVSDASSWAVQQGGEFSSAISKVRTVWNGATRDDHEEAGANGVTAPNYEHSLDIIGALLDIPGLTSINWLFFETTPGGNVSCSDDSLVEKTAPLNPNGLTYPSGTWDLTLEGQQCQYKNSGDNAGRLFCGDKAYDCHVHARVNEDKWKCFQFWRRLAVTCEF